jgi:ribosomal protein L44E
MHPVSYECTQCHKRWAKAQCILDNDEMNPMGPERLCPNCKAITMTKVHPVLITLAVLIAVGIGAWVAYLLG